MSFCAPYRRSVSLTSAPTSTFSANKRLQRNRRQNPANAGETLTLLLDVIATLEDIASGTPVTSGVDLRTKIGALNVALKTFGAEIEQTNFSFLDQLATNFRLACKKPEILDPGSRLLILEILEVREMMWTPQDSVQNYYKQKIRQIENGCDESPTSPTILNAEAPEYTPKASKKDSVEGGAFTSVVVCDQKKLFISSDDHDLVKLAEKALHRFFDSRVDQSSPSLKYSRSDLLSLSSPPGQSPPSPIASVLKQFPDIVRKSDSPHSVSPDGIQKLEVRSKKKNFLEVLKPGAPVREWNEDLGEWVEVDKQTRA